MVDLTQYKALFLEEARGYIQQLNTLMLSLEKNSDNTDLLNRIMAVSHTFKGISATMGYNRLAGLAHAFEDIFDSARKGEFKIAREMFPSLFDALDALESGVKTVESEDKDSTDEAVAQNIRTLFQNGGKEKIQDKETKRVRVKQAEPKNADQKKDETQAISRIGVEVKKLDMLMNLIEELAVERLKISHLSSDGGGELRALSRRLDRIVSDLQYNISRARMVPLEFIFMRFPRLVRDAAKTLDKEASLQISGAAVEMDRALVEMLSEPLVHLIKNAVDHGIESSEKRISLKKDKSGVISINATETRGAVRLAVSDDGGGINWEEVARIAVSKNIVSENKTNEWIAFLRDKKNVPKELVELLFRPDFSTKTDISEISGRGVGLSVVKDYIDRTGGKITVETAIGKGTSFILEIPSALSATEALLVQVAEEFFAIPFSSISRSVLVSSDTIKSFSDGDVAVVNGEELPLLWMRKFFNLPTNRMVYTVVIAGKEPYRAGLVIDRIVSEQEVVVKPFSSALKAVEGFSGATVLGDGRVALVVDVASLLEQKEFFGRAN